MLAPARSLTSLVSQKSTSYAGALVAHRPCSLLSSRTLPILNLKTRTAFDLRKLSSFSSGTLSLAQALFLNNKYQSLSHTRTRALTTKESTSHTPTRAQSSSSASPAASDEATMVRTVKVDVTSDTVCPWCFVGKKNLEAAIAQLPEGIDVEVTWRPFQLNPNAPKEGVSKEKMYREKFGPRVPAMMERMSGIFAGFGQKISLGGLTGNTLDSHRLLWWARHGPQGSAGKQNALAEELFLDYFTREKYIGDRDVLAEAAERVGLMGAREFLDDPEAGVKEVQQELREYGQGVTGVPYFRIAGQQLSGAQPPEVFAEVLKQAAS